MINKLLNISDIKQTTAVVAQIVSEKNVDVSFVGDQAMCEYAPDGKLTRIILPNISDDDSAEFKETLAGYVDHECGHALFSNAEVGLDYRTRIGAEFGEKAAKCAMNFFNVFEDARIESLMRNRYRGSKRNLANTVETLFNRNKDELNDPAKSNQDKIAGTIWVYTRALRGDEAAIQIMNKNPIAFAPVKMLHKSYPNLFDESTSATTDEEIWKTVYQFILDLKNEADGQDQNGQQPTDDNGEQDGSRITIQLNDKNENEGQQNEEENEEEQKQENQAEGKGDSKTKGKSGKESDKSKDDEKSEGDKKSDKGKESKNREKPESAKEEGGEEQKGGKGADSFDEMMDELNVSDKFKKSLDDFVKENFANKIKNHEPYLPFTTDHDVIQKINLDGIKTLMEYRMSSRNSFVDEASKHINVVQKQLEKFMSAKSISLWEYGQKKGSLYGAGLVKLKTGNEAIFRKKIENKTKDVAVSLLIDCSGSMCGKKIYRASQAAYVFATALNRMNINYEILGFTTLPLSRLGLDRSRAEEECNRANRWGSAFSRFEPLYIPIFKEFGERFSSDTLNTLVALEWDSELCVELRNNVDGESVLIAAKRLAAQPQKRKLLIVFSDGYPAWYGCSQETGYKHLEDSLKKVEKMGVETFGIGIMDDGVKNFYKNHVVIKQLDDLSKTLLSKLKEFLFK